MFSIKWSKGGNFPLLSEAIREEIMIRPPRPVFFEELDMFGLNNHWEYPKSEAPLLWAIGRSYFYKGVEVARIVGGNLSSDPVVEVLHRGTLKPVDLKAMIAANEDRLSSLENEAKFFIKNVKNSRGINEQISVAYSGGKDSQVILELVSQVIVPSEYIVIYTNTGMELPNNPQIVDNAIKCYKDKFPELRFETAKAQVDMVNNWKFFGPPSRMHRWCCSVAKSIPFYVAISKISEQKSFIVFEGVRREESNARNNYERTANHVKHSMVKNVRPIIEWNDTEVYMYLFYRDCKINSLYRYGLTRVGCSICPFSSDWSEYIISKLDPNLNNRYYDVIAESFKHNGISDPDKRCKYLKEGKWKVRGGDKILADIGSDIRMVSAENGLLLEIKNPRTSLFEWLKIFDHHISVRDENNYDVIIKNDKYTASYQIEMLKEGIIVHFNPGNAPKIDQDFKKMLNKVTFCFSCLCCMIECPTGAIQFNPSLNINESLCTKCHNCLHAINKGCLVAASRSISLTGDIMKRSTKNPDRYSTFGLRESWLIAHLNSTNGWINALGSKQQPAVKRWLLESELICDGKKTDLSNILSTLTIEEAWGIIWTNLCYNSEIVRWYHNVEYNDWDRIELQTSLFSDYAQYAEGTVKNPFGALLNMLDSSVVLSEYYGQGIVEKKGNRFVRINKRGIEQIENTVLLYSLYRYNISIHSNSFTLKELFDPIGQQTLIKVFGLNKDSVAKQLISLQEHRSKLVRVEFASNLDNIFLNKDLSATEALSIYLEG